MDRCLPGFALEIMEEGSPLGSITRRPMNSQMKLGARGEEVKGRPSSDNQGQDPHSLPTCGARPGGSDFHPHPAGQQHGTNLTITCLYFFVNGTLPATLENEL